ncbi:uncharacterized protein LOC132277604 [Cornus florida]|uniref:uncharacterized protein LOC132277604 n=1 Tax=Cornus florida TaxID=4283 RepID=UPI0028A26B3A|nr:uncharacterized protein LOC132277604 [Cornus florida]
MASSSRCFPLPGSNSSSSSSNNPVDALIQHNQDAFSSILNSVNLEIVEQVFKPRKKRYIHCDREGSHHQLMKDYFGKNCTYPLEYFHRRFKMRRELFLYIMNDVKAYDDYFIQKRDATGRLGLSFIQKMTTVIRILLYGCVAYHCNKYIKIGERTAIETLMTFCKIVFGVYGVEYMRPPNEADTAQLLQEGEERGFQDHPAPNYSKRKTFCSQTRGCRKDVERAFGVLQIKWAITQGPVRFWDKGDLCLIVKTCIILHNMIIEDEHHANVGRWTPPPEETISIPTLIRNPLVLAAHIFSRQVQIRNKETNTQLRKDLIEDLWSRFGEENIAFIYF